MKPETRIICGAMPVRQEPSGPRLAIDNTGELAALERAREDAHAAYRAACRARDHAHERVIEALTRIAYARAALDRALGRRSRCE